MLRYARFLVAETALEQKSENLNHLTLPEIKDFNALKRPAKNLNREDSLEA